MPHKEQKDLTSQQFVEIFDSVNKVDECPILIIDVREPHERELIDLPLYNKVYLAV